MVALGLVLVLVVGGAVTAVVLLSGADRARLIGNGVPQTLPSVPTQEPEEAWTWSYDGTLTAGFADGDGAVVSATPEPDTSATVTRLDADGEEVWSVDFDEARSGTPVGDDHVLGLGGDNAGPTVEMASVDDEEVLWSKEASYLGDLADGVLLVVDGGRRVALADLDDGSERWGESSELATFEGDRVLLARDGEVRLLDAADGEEQWSAEAGDVRSLTLSGDLAVVGTDDGLRALDRSDGEEVWTSGGSEGQPFATVAGGVAVVADDEVRVFDADGPLAGASATPDDFAGLAGARVSSWAAQGGDLLSVGSGVYDERGRRVELDDCEVPFATAQGVVCASPDGARLVGEPADDGEEVWSLDLDDAGFGFLVEGGVVALGDGELVGLR